LSSKRKNFVILNILLLQSVRNFYGLFPGAQEENGEDFARTLRIFEILGGGKVAKIRITILFLHCTMGSDP
jgi:hypothetical protein